jgi:cell division protein FtsB
METLEAAVPDEKIRMSAVFASLKIQGLNKDMLISSAEKYHQILEKDKLEFQNAVNTKVLAEIEGRKTSVEELEKRNTSNAEQIKNLTKEINDNLQKINALKKEVIDEEAKINNNKNGYNIACDAMLAKLGSDINKIKSTL